MSQAADLVSAELLTRLALRPASVSSQDGIVYGISALDITRPQLAVIADDATPLVAFEGETSDVENRRLLLGPLNAANAVALRRHLPWLRPQVLGLQTSVGLGDRLGLATPGHLRALRAVGGNLAPIPAQQSIREMGRTGRSPQQVMDDAMWGVFSEGWRAGFGADADHLKTLDDVDQCVAAGYTFFTFDPGAYVDSTADVASNDDLRDRFRTLPWEQLADTPNDLARRYLASPIDCDGHRISFDEITLHRAAVKYGRAIAHVSSLYQRLTQLSEDRAWEVEVSVDETETPTSHAEHVYWARELSRLGVRWVSLAPRFVGTFEKGVDYIGDLTAFAQDVAVHAAIARAHGPYKLSLHSGSDKFSIYDTCVRGDTWPSASQDRGNQLPGSLADHRRTGSAAPARDLCVRLPALRGGSRQLSCLSTPGSRSRSSKARVRRCPVTRAVRCARDLACDVRLGANGADR